jgi:hypothetical protein
VLALLLFSASALVGLLVQGLFVFNLSDGIPLASPIATALDICVQMFLSVLQLVCASMLWKLRRASQDPLLLAGVQRACVVIVGVQVVVFALFGVVSDAVLWREAFLAVVGAFALVVGGLLLRVWRTDMLRSRATMLATALRIDAVALVVLVCYALLHVSQNVDAWQSGSVAFATAVRHNQWLLFVSALCLLVLLYIVLLWVLSPPSKVGKSSVDDAHCERIQFANALCAGIGLMGAPIVVPCLVASILVQATRVSMQTGEATQNADIFYVSKGDRFNDEW